MAYNHQMVETRVEFAAALTTAGTGVFAPGFIPQIMVACSVVISVAVTVANEGLTIRYRPGGPGQTSGQVTLGTMTLPFSGSAIGQCYYLRFVNQQLVKPGETVEITSDGLSTAGDGIVILTHYPSWEQPANVSDMIQLTA